MQTSRMLFGSLRICPQGDKTERSNFDQAWTNLNNGNSQITYYYS